MYRLLSLVLVLSTLGACAQTSESGVRTDLDVNEVSQLMQDGKEIVLIDVRTPQEYEQGHLEGAELMNIYDADFESRMNELDKEKEYVVYCRSGGRSGKAAAKMEKLGFKNIHNMKGGILAWNRAGLETKK